MKRRDFFKVITGFVAGMFALPKAKAKYNLGNYPAEFTTNDEVDLIENKDFSGWNSDLIAKEI